MNLIFFIYSLGSGGAERVTATLANHWAAKGWQVTVVTLASRALDFYELHPSVRRIDLNMAGESAGLLKAIINNLRRVLALHRVITQLKPDVAVSMMSTANVQLALATIGLRGVVTVASERIHPPRLPLGTFWETLRARFYGNLGSVVALTTESATWLQRNTRARQVVVIPNVAMWPLPVQPPHLDPPPRYGGQRLLLAVGRLDEQKGFDVLIAVFDRLAEQFPHWRLVILGEGPDRKLLEMQIENAGLKNRVSLPGRAGNVAQWYEAADLYVMTSRFEGFPNTLAEAMAHGLPTVSFDCDTGPRDIIRHEIDGLLVPNGNTDALENALHRLMRDSVLREKFGAKAIEARVRFSLKSIVGAWESIFNELASCNKKKSPSVYSNKDN